MATEYLYLQGKVKWVRPTAPDPWGKWKHVLYPNQDSYNKLMEYKEPKDGTSGFKNVIKKDEDGYFITLSRPTQMQVKGKIVGMAPPEMLDKDNKPLRDILVGNGSDATVKVSVYKHGVPGADKAKKAYAIRWEAMRVDNLIPYEGKRDFDEHQQKQAAGLVDQPEQLF